jgi:hypothetical protein
MRKSQKESAMANLRLRVVLASVFTALIASEVHAVTLARAPEMLEARPMATTVQLLWSPGGDADGTLHDAAAPADHVVSYTVQRKVGNGSWQNVHTGDATLMTYVDDISGLASPNWWDQRPSLTYRVSAKTSDNVTTLSNELAVTAKLPAWLQESYDAKARIAWLPSTAPAGYPVHLGYIVQRNIGGAWTNKTGYVQDLAYVDPVTSANGTYSTYRVLTVYQQASPGTATNTRISNGQNIKIHAMCEGQETDPTLPPLHVIEIGDLDENTLYEGDDIAIALDQCRWEEYEIMGDSIGDDDGECSFDESVNLQNCVLGGCILRALPVSYDNVAIRITSRPDCEDDASPTHPLQCFASADFPAGLVIEGHGSQSVFRSPLWQSLGSPIPLPAPVLEVHRHDMRVTLRNLVLDGRKFEQEPPGTVAWHSWWHGGLYVWNSGPWADQTRPIPGGLPGDGDNICDYEVCTEDGTPGPTTHDDDGKCEAGETCVENNAADGGDNDGVCDNDSWSTAEACESTKQANDGCLHNVEVRDVPGAYGVLISHAENWIIEDSEFHDVGCVNRGYGYDCPNFASAADVEVGGVVPIPGFKTFGIGLHVGEYTADFQVRRNQAYRTTKYALSFKNASAIDCNGLLRNHEVSENVLHDVGGVGIFNHGTVGARIHDNTISNTTTWDERTSWGTPPAPPVTNVHDGPYGMSLGGYCSDDNRFYDNEIFDVAGPAILWHGDTQTVVCSGNDCDPVLTPVGNTIAGNTIDGTCQEKVVTAGTTNEYGGGSINIGHAAGGTLHLTDNTLIGSECRFVAAAVGASTGISPLDVRISGGSYESGPNIATQAQGGFYSGPLHVHGHNRKFVIGGDTEIKNTTASTVPEVTVGYGATLVIDDRTTNPFVSAPGAYSSAIDVGGGSVAATLVSCYDTPSHPDCD